MRQACGGGVFVIVKRPISNFHFPFVWYEASLCSQVIVEAWRMVDQKRNHHSNDVSFVCCRGSLGWLMSSLLEFIFGAYELFSSQEGAKSEATSCKAVVLLLQNRRQAQSWL